MQQSEGLHDPLRDARKTVFLVDRSDSFIMYLRILLERMGFRVVPLKKGALLRELMPIVRPDLVLLGSVVEGTDPVEVLGGLAAQPGGASVPVILISARGEEGEGLDWRAAGFAARLGRPINIFRLFKVVYDRIVFSSGEKRAHLRTPFHEKVAVSRGGERFMLRATTLSEGGLFVRTAELMRQGERLRLEVPLGFGAPDLLEGEVLYRRRAQEDEPAVETGVAIRFADLTQDQAARLTVCILGLLVGDILEDQEEPVLSLVSQTNTLYEDIVREHIRLGQELRRSQEYLAAVLEALPMGMLAFRVGEAGGLEQLTANPVARRMFGAGEGEGGPVAGPDWEVLGLAESLKRVAREGGVVQESNLELPGEDGRRFFDVLIFQAQPGVAAALVSDVTRRRHSEEEQGRLQKLESLGLLAGGIAHDFNNLLQGISGSVDVACGLLGDGTEDCPAERVARVLYLLGQAQAGVGRASRLSRQLLTFARGGDPLIRTVTVGPILAEALEIALPGGSVAGRIELPEGLRTVRGDPDQLHQAFTNLILNARQAMPQGGEVVIGAENVDIGPGDASLPPGEYVAVSLRDTGVGIPAEILPKVFDPYFSTKQEGSGLGLPTALSIVHRHGGWIDVASAPGRGTTVRVLLPSAAPPAAACGVAEAPQRKRQRGGRVLVMDDEELLWPGLRGMLENLGYASVFTRDGAGMLSAYAGAFRTDEPFDAVLLDLTVRSGMGGEEAARRLLELDPDARAVVSSGYATAPILSRYRRFGFRAALPKPYSVAALARALEEALE